MRRLILAAGGALLLVLGSLAALAAITNDLALHDRHAMRAFFQWQRNPTPETETAWHEARRRALIRDTTFKAICFGMTVICFALGWKMTRVFRQVRPGTTAYLGKNSMDRT
jgi:hypothetical protein